MADFSLKIKEEFRSTVVGYNHSGLPLGQRNDLHILAEMALSDKFLANMFDELPTREKLDAYKEELFLESHPVKEEEVQKESVTEETSTNTVPTMNPEEHGSDAE